MKRAPVRPTKATKLAKTAVKTVKKASPKSAKTPKKPSTKKKTASTQTESQPPFAGFPIEMLHFLYELEANNNREWFHENKWRYEQHLLVPALSFIQAMQKPLEKVTTPTPQESACALLLPWAETPFQNAEKL